MPEHNSTFELKGLVPEFKSSEEALEFLVLVANSYKTHWVKVEEGLNEILSSVAAVPDHPKVLEGAIKAVQAARPLLMGYLYCFEQAISQLRLFVPDDHDKSH